MIRRLTAAFVTALVMTITLSGCHTIVPEMDADLSERYAGRSVDDFIINHGSPTSASPLTDGRAVLDWRLGESVTRRGLSNEMVYCHVRAVVSPDRIVQSIAVVETTGSTGMRFTRCGEVLTLE